MPKVLHILAGDAPPEAIDQLDLLARAQDAAISIGPPPRRPRSVACRIQPRLFNSPTITAAMRLPNVAQDFPRICAWSPQAMRAGLTIARRHGAALSLMLSRLPGRDERRGLIRRLRRHRFAVIVPVEPLRAGLIACGAPPETVHVVPPAARACADPLAARQALRRRIGLDEELRLIAVPSPMLRHAGHKFAIWAHAVIRQIHAGVGLLFRCDGPAERQVRWFASTTGYGDEAHFLDAGQFSLPQMLAAADVAALFHVRSTSPAVLAATMAAGTPAAVSDHPELLALAGADAVRVAPRGDGSEARLARNASAALLELLEGRELRDALACAAGQRAKAFEPAAVRSALEAVWAQHVPAVGGTGAPRAAQSPAQSPA